MKPASWRRLVAGVASMARRRAPDRAPEAKKAGAILSCSSPHRGVARAGSSNARVASQMMQGRRCHAGAWPPTSAAAVARVGRRRHPKFVDEASPLLAERAASSTPSVYPARNGGRFTEDELLLG